MHDKRMTADALASIVGVTRQSIGYYQNGDRTPDAVTLGKIAQGLGVSADYLLGNTNTATLNEDAQAASKLTGLSGEAIETLASSKSAGDAAQFYRALEILLAARREYRIGDPLTLLSNYADILFDSAPQERTIVLNAGNKITYCKNEAICAALRQTFFDMIEDIFGREILVQRYGKDRTED